MTEQPRDMDVLLGRGVGIYRHPGNERFRLIVSEYAVSNQNWMLPSLSHTK